MAGNRFDFEVEAQDHASATIQQLEEKIGKLLPQLDEAGDKMSLGGRKTRDGLDDLNDRLEKTGIFAKNSVQYFGDMVPPLKMVGELAGRYGGAIAKIGIGGAAAYGAGQAIASVAGSMKDAAEDAYNLSVQAMNAGMSVHDLTEVAGGMRLLGANTDEARASVVALSRSLTDALKGRNNSLRDTLNQIGVSINERADGTADVMKTLEKLTEVFPTIAPQTQKTVSDALGFSPELLALLREGVHYKELMAKSDKVGLTVPDDTVQKLNGLNDAINEISASWEGLKNRTKNKMADLSMSDISIGGHKIIKSGVKDGMEGIADLFQNDDYTGLSHALGFINTEEANELRKIQGNKELYNSLTRRERGAVDAGFMTNAVKKRYESWYHPIDVANQFQQDINSINKKHTAGLSSDNHGIFNQPRNNSLGLRNHNPVNLRSASNETGKEYSEKSGYFSTFSSDEDGLAAASRQLFLYGDRGKHTLQDVIKTFAPSKENNVQSYVDDVSRDSGFKPGENIDLHSPYVLERLLPAMIKHEQGTQPFSYDEVNKGINDAIFDPRWSSRRDPNQLKAQRAGSEHPLLSQYPPKSNADTKDAQKTPIMQQDSPGENEGSNNTIITKDDTAAILKALQETLSQAAKGGTTQVEVKFVKPNGEEELVRVPFGGKTSTSMSTY